MEANSGVPARGAVDGAAVGASGSAGSGQPLSSHGDIPMEFTEFQKLYDRWVGGGISDQAVRMEFGAATLEMMEAQRIVVCDAGSQREGAEPASGRPGPSHRATPAEPSVGSSRPEPPAASETFLDTLLDPGLSG